MIMEKIYCRYCKIDLDAEDDLDVIIQNDVTFWYCNYCDNALKSMNTKTLITTYY